MEQDWTANSVSAEEYRRLVEKDLVTYYNQAAFTEINKSKVDEVLYILIKKKESLRFAIVLGCSNGMAMCPFSAPFGYPEEIKKNQSIQDYMCAEKALEDFLREKGIKHISMIFPPAFYDKKVIETWINVLSVNKWDVSLVDLNFALHISDVIGEYELRMLRNGRKNLRIAEQAGLKISECSSEEECITGYNIIKDNRDSKGYPLRMTKDDVLQTMSAVPSKMYIVRTSDDINIAAALVYSVTKEVAEVIYWGDIPGYSEYKSINFLSYELMKIYDALGYKYLDIGPGSNENRFPSYGLCDFKDSIACERRIKIYMCKDIK